MEYRETDQVGWNQNRDSALRISNTIHEQNRYRNVILGCMDQEGEESFRLLRLKVVPDRDMYWYFNLNRIRNREMITAFTQLYRKGIRWIIPILDTREIRSPGDSVEIEGVMGHWIADACKATGLFPSDLLYVHLDEGEDDVESERENEAKYGESFLPAWEDVV